MASVFWKGWKNDRRAVTTKMKGKLKISVAATSAGFDYITDLEAKKFF